MFMSVSVFSWNMGNFLKGKESLLITCTLRTYQANDKIYEIYNSKVNLKII